MGGWVRRLGLASSPPPLGSLSNSLQDKLMFGGTETRSLRGGGVISCGNYFTRGNHLEERLLDQAQARASYTPIFGGSFA